MKIAPGTCMNSDTPALFRRETRQREIVEVNETVKQLSGGVDLHGEPRFGKVYLNFMRSLLQATPYLGFMLAQQIFDELFPRIVWKAVGRVHQAQGRWRYHGLLHRHV